LTALLPGTAVQVAAALGISWLGVSPCDLHGRTRPKDLARLDALSLLRQVTHLSHSQMSERRLGAFAVRDPSMVPRLMTGGSIGLDKTDQLLCYMNEAPIGPAFVGEVEAFLSASGQAIPGRGAIRDRRGGRSPPRSRRPAPRIRRSGGGSRRPGGRGPRTSCPWRGRRRASSRRSDGRVRPEWRRCV